MAKPKYISMRAYATHRGVDESTVRQAVTEGKIKTFNVDGKKKIHWKLADKMWAENTDLSKKRTKKEDVPFFDEQGGEFYRARAQREKFQAKLTELKFEKESQDVIPLSVIKAEWFRISRTVRDKLMNAPDRLTARATAIPEGPDRDAKINAIWREEIRSILEEMSDAGKRNGYETNDSAPSVSK